MAVTKIIPIRTTIQNSVDYICNPDKTDDQLLIYSENCYPHTAGLEFQHFMNQTRAGGNTIGRHLIQSFAPGEVSPEQAHEIGKKMAAEILKGEYAYVMATHIDRGHVHNHFVWGVANIVTHNKYRSNKNTYHEIRDISDRLCKENELSVIEPQTAKTYGKNYGSYRPEQTSGSWRGKLKSAIDSFIPQAEDFEHLLKLMEAQGYKVKRGKYISFCAEGQERFTRAKSLGEGYTEEEIKKRILEKPEIIDDEPEPPALPTPTLRRPIISPPTPTPPAVTPPVKKPITIKPKIDIDENPKYAASRGLERWANIQNLKNKAAAFNLVLEYGGMEAFLKLLNDCRTDLETIENGIKANSERVRGLRYFRNEIKTYYRTKAVYKQYTEIKLKFFKERFRAKNENDIIAHKSAASYLKDFKRPLRKVEDIDAEIARIKAANVNNNNSLAVKKTEFNQLRNIHSHLFYLVKEFEPPAPPKRQIRSRNRSHDIDI